MTLLALTKTPEFNRLTTLQATWVIAYLKYFETTGFWEPMAATAAAYHCQTVASLRTHGYHMLENRRVQKTLRLFSKAAVRGAKVPTQPRFTGAQVIKQLFEKVAAQTAAV
jgi:hypothetical protein